MDSPANSPLDSPPNSPSLGGDQPPLSDSSPSPSGDSAMAKPQNSKRSKRTAAIWCLNTEDGGAVSLDWPANLVLEEESGLDTTVLIIPGTPEGSNEGKIKEFVYDCLKTGLFPVVMNPRGCTGSPLTTARIITEDWTAFLSPARVDGSFT
ncbi:alpha/beta-Hydrolases superfamily protein [Abeliophyllum distichum]|uniref:Alpha/beta-Hydrolases superfamily protein n=1 Tax=Abeliophyllum distichum TaxID=126358 RepID=A0ABD1SEQ4_9LAMI